MSHLSTIPKKYLTTHIVGGSPTYRSTFLPPFQTFDLNERTTYSTNQTTYLPTCQPVIFGCTLKTWIMLVFLSFFSNLFKFGGNHQSLLTESKLVRGENLFRQKIQLIDHFLWSSFNGKPTNWKTEIYLRISLGNVAKNLLFLLFWNGGEDNDDNVL